MVMKGKIYTAVIEWSMALFVILFVACTDEFYNRNRESGKTVHVSKLILTTSKAGDREIALTRADSYSEVEEVTLFVFNNNGESEDYFDVPNLNLQEMTSTDNRERKYQITSSIEMTTGAKTIYAVANPTAAYWQNCIEDLKYITDEDSFKRHLYSINQNLAENQSLPLLSDGIVPLFGFGEITVSEINNGQGEASGEIHVERPMARIRFNIQNTSTNSKGNRCIFSPREYTIHNVAQQSSIIEIPESLLEVETDTRDYYTTNSENVPAAIDDVSTFTFYLPENIQKEANGATSYHDRDKWNPDAQPVEGEEKAWTIAPPKSTYIVITGQYSETDKNGTLIYQGEVVYTIHLGDFSNRKWNNFSVQRNYRYTYTVKILGVDEIVTEATTEGLDGKQPGAEGSIIGNAQASQVFDLDCHYEQAYVYYDLTDIATNLTIEDYDNLDEAIAYSFILKSSTPFAPDTEYILPYLSNLNGETEENATEGMDYKWIYFLSHQENEIAHYPGDQCKSNNAYSNYYNTYKYLINPYELCVSLGKLTKMIYNNNTNDIISTAKDMHIDLQFLQVPIDNGNREGHYIVRFTAFIDENYYQIDPISRTARIVGWDEYTRQNDRTMLIASNIQISKDENSTYSTARTAFIQRSIQTYYNSQIAETQNAMGVETYCENNAMNGLGLFHNGTHTYSPTDGRENMIYLINYNNDDILLWDTSIQINQNGYFDTNSSNYDGHRIDNEAENNYIMQKDYRSSPYYACLSRNRDLDGDGKIDGNEIRWYLPACDQYLRMNIGADAMSEASRLFLGTRSDIGTKTYPDDFYEQGSLYITSSYSIDDENDERATDIKQVLWAAEVGAFGDFPNSRKVLVRCVRNLPSKTVINKNCEEVVVDGRARGDVSYTLKQNGHNYIFDFENRLDERIYRVEYQSGSYGHHYEEPLADASGEVNDANRLPKGFVVARYNYGAIDDGRANIISNEQRSNIWAGTEDPCSTYSEPGTVGNVWRTPNLREMMVMSTQANLLGFYNWQTLQDATSNSIIYFLISTDFSGRAGKREGYLFQSRRNGKRSGFITVQPSSRFNYIRCVRDMTEEDLIGATVVGVNN